jgi:hypothetical protein
VGHYHLFATAVWALLAVALVLTASGCGKKKAVEASATPPGATQTAPSTANTPTAPGASNTTPTPTTQPTTSAPEQAQKKPDPSDLTDDDMQRIAGLKMPPNNDERNEIRKIYTVEYRTGVPGDYSAVKAKNEQRQKEMDASVKANEDANKADAAERAKDPVQFEYKKTSKFHPLDEFFENNVVLDGARIIILAPIGQQKSGGKVTTTAKQYDGPGVVTITYPDIGMPIQDAKKIRVYGIFHRNGDKRSVDGAFAEWVGPLDDDVPARITVTK